ncbi:hypothetical protein [Francisella tularensis]|uniref:hypothetical protein n=1 Tax=Francisella tularensis TaxID=263 RepID=UPI0008F50ADF|nr:hypothetical protein [Francisella tularensis]APA83250.1 hypothetical protein N894_1266 [Francisella tularensis subsp. novicida PA10-7858]
MWISPKFHLFVIRTFDNLVNEQMKEAQEESKRLLKNEKLRSSAYKRMRDETTQQLEKFKEYHHNQISKWKYEVEQMRKDNKPVFDLKNIRNMDKYTVSYLTCNDANLDRLFRSLQNCGIDITPFLREWTSSKIFLRILKEDIQKMFGVANHLIGIEEEMTKTIYSHELIGIC